MDYGARRTGLAISDALCISTKTLVTVSPEDVVDWIKACEYYDEIDTIVIGLPSHVDDEPLPVVKEIMVFKEKIEKNFPDLKIVLQDENYTSQDAMQWMIHYGVKKKKRADKSYLDQVSAMMILRRYLKLDL